MEICCQIVGSLPSHGACDAGGLASSGKEAWQPSFVSIWSLIEASPGLKRGLSIRPPERVERAV